MMKLTEVLDKKIFQEDISPRRGVVDSILGTFQLDNLPVAISESEWSVLEEPERITRKFTFESILSLKQFLDDIIDYQEYKNHHAKVIIEEKSVTVESYTHDFDGVTSLDKELARFCDDTYVEITYREEEEVERG